MTIKIVFVGEAYGEQEELYGKAMVGPTGIELLKLCHEAGIISLTRADWKNFSEFWNTRDGAYVDLVWQEFPHIHRTNVINQRPFHNKLEAFCGTKAEGIKGWPAVIKGKYLLAQFRPELERLAEEIDDLNPNLVVALGNTAMWALLGQTAITKNRGTTSISSHTITGFKVLPTYHPAAIFQQYKIRPVVVIDLQKAQREMEFPEIRRPARQIWIDPTLEDLEEFYDRFIAPLKGTTRLLSVDIETAGTIITSIGFAPAPDKAIVIPFTDPRKKNRLYWPTAADESIAKRFVKRILEDPSIRKLFQNGLYDIAFLWRSDGIRTFGAEDDTMLLHHALQPESLKSLGFLGSIYTDEGSWKQLREDIETIKRDD